jgi:RNA polymerase primary sigma factor
MSVKSIKVDDYEKSTAAYFKLIKDNKPLTKNEEKILWEKFHKQKDMKAREKLINANLRFVPTIAKQFKGCGLPFADIIEEGNIGLIKAIDRFNPQKDNKVISYAVWWIRKTIIEAIEKKGVINAENITDVYNQSLSKDKKNNEVTSKFIIPETSFDNTEKSPLYKKEIVEILFDGIPERERIIISDYYGLDGDLPRTLDEIGIDLNLTKERVRQLNEKGLKKMRSNALTKNIEL